MSRELLVKLLGDRPTADPDNHMKIAETTRDRLVIETHLLDLNGIERVPAYFIKPSVSTDPLPVIVYNHSHGGNYTIGKNEVLKSSPYLQQTSFAEELTAMGYAVLAIDAWGFNERSGKKESELFKEMLVNGKVMWGMMLFDSLNAIDYLETRSDIDLERIATIGMSMGGLMSWWMGALDERIKVTIDLSAQVDLETLIKTRSLDRHGFYNYVPSLLKHFTTASIQSLIVPRYRISLVGKDDPLCPIEGVEKVNKILEEKYAEHQSSSHFKKVITSGGHQETAHMRAEWKTFLKNHL